VRTICNWSSIDNKTKETLVEQKMNNDSMIQWLDRNLSHMV